MENGSSEGNMILFLDKSVNLVAADNSVDEIS